MATISLTPSTTSLAPNVFGSTTSQTTPKQAYVASLSPSQSVMTPPSSNVKAPAANTGGNPSATSPAKSTFVDSQVSSGAGVSPYSTNGNFTTPSGAVVNGATGQLVTPPSGSSGSPAPTTPAVDPNASRTAAYTAYLASLNPPDELTGDQVQLTSVQKQLADAQLQASKDNDYALEKPGETTGFASGEAARVARNNAYQTDAYSNEINALTGKINSEQSAQSAKTTQAKARLDYEQSLIPDNKPFSLSPGQTQYDSSGKVIASLPEAPSTAAPKIIGDASTGYYSVGADGKLTSLLGAAPKNLTQQQTTQQAYGQINQLLTMADGKGVPYIDNNGFFTPEGFKSIVENAAEDGLTRSDILAEYGDKIYGPGAKKYGLTPKEISDLGF